MAQSTGASMQQTVRDMEQHTALWDEAQFVPRVYALDVLSFQVLEHIENVQYVHGYHADLARLYHRAAALWQRLAAVNQQLFTRLRAQVIAAPDTAACLRHLCATYVGEVEQPMTWEDMDADYLDIFLNGVLGIAAPPAETRPLQSGMIGYHPTPARAILALVQRLRLRPHDVFYDLGSGLGRVALLVGLLTPAQVRGIEFEPAYCAYAQERAAALHLRRVTFHNVDARQAVYTDGTVFFLYTPFTGQLMRDVLARLHAESQTRPLTVVGYGACVTVMEQQPWLTRTGQQTFTHDTLAIFRNTSPQP